ncbi:MAG: response regulator transcription factor [Geodermatophilaceae bacterium]
MIRVLLADDQTLVRDGLRMILSARDDIEVVGEAATGVDAVAAARSLNPDVVLMDIRMPVMNGVEATRELMHSKGKPDACRVLVLTTVDLDEYVYAAMKAGASGFLLKDVPRRQLVEAVRTIADGDTLLAPAVTQRLIEHFLVRPAPARGIPVPLRSLTERELAVLRLVAEGLTNAEIAARLFLGVTTVKTHLGHVLAKLGLRDRVQAIVLAYETGLVTPGMRRSTGPEQRC